MPPYYAVPHGIMPMHGTPPPGLIKGRKAQVVGPTRDAIRFCIGKWNETGIKHDRSAYFVAFIFVLYCRWS